MAGHFTNLLCHMVWSTKGRCNLLNDELRPALYGYVGGTLKHIDAHLVVGGGTENHIHFLVSYPPNRDVSKLINVIKSNSSRWIHETRPELRDFAWQEGYGGFSVSMSQRGRVEKYIRAQLEHHGGRTFEEEFVGLLIKHQISYDERHLWD
jgi:putative transposase